jgi:hypothetical protein
MALLEPKCGAKRVGVKYHDQADLPTGKSPGAHFQ